ncbi:MAG: hypothetical protein AB7G37_19775 [Solirubrobacteraceae bacterium]
MPVPRRLSTLVAVTVPVLVTFPPAASADRDLTGATFRASVPDAWTLQSRRHPDGSRMSRSASKGRLDVVNIPRRGRLGITVLEARLTARGRRRSVSKLTDGLVGWPTASTRGRLIGRGETRIGGVRGVVRRSTYRYKGRRIYQHNTVLRRKGRVIFLETISDVSRRASNDSTRARFVRTWRWR